MKKYLLLFSFFIFEYISNIYSQVHKTPYPIIFVHGLKSSDKTFSSSAEFLNDNFSFGPLNVFDVVLNADDDDETAVMSVDVKWQDFEFGDRFINVGRRDFRDDIDDCSDGWSPSSLFAVNFQEERIRGAAGFWNDYFDRSDQAAIFKQGYALSKVIKEVLDFTGAEKVILVGHSMGGLAIREYLQRTDENHIHVNWIDPYSEDGHKVAKVITLGTPHLGSNTGLDPTKSGVLDEKSEAVRDLKYSYDSYTNCNSSPVGIYLFGGNENCIAPTDDNETFYNVDINCNGSTTDNIVGINFSTYDNPYMPLPENIPYTWVTSIYGEVAGLVGDGAVAIDRQWLYVGNEPAPLGITDTIMTDVIHTSEPDDVYTLIRALDVPGSFNFAYHLFPDSTYYEFITYQTNNYYVDIDAFYVNTRPVSHYVVSLDNNLSGVQKIEVYNQNGMLVKESYTNSFPATVEFTNASDTIMYVLVLGMANSQSFMHPYQINITEEYQYIQNTYSKELNVYYSNNTINFGKQVKGNISVYNMAGQKIYRHYASSPIRQLGVNLPAGIYTVSVNNNEKIIVGKIAVTQ